MAQRNPTGVRELRRRLVEAEQTLGAIRAGDVDAVIVSSDAGARVVTLAGTDLAFHVLFEHMSEGAMTLTPEGAVVYCNQRFAGMMRTRLSAIVGKPLRAFVPRAGHGAYDALLRGGQVSRTRGDLRLRSRGGATIPVSLSFAPLQRAGAAEAIGIIGVVTDTTEQELAAEARALLIHRAMAAQEDERRRIARELHDETAQSLTALLVGLRAMEHSATLSDVIAQATRLRAVAAQTLDEVGRLSRGLHASIIDDLGLARAVAHHAEEFTQLHGIAVDVRTGGLDNAEPLPPLLQGTVYRVFQEALTNVARHARARSVAVRLLRDDTAVELHVRDDGAGFDASDRAAPAAGEQRRLGLQAIRERATLLGGSARIDSKAGRGTSVAVRLPLTAPSRAARA